MPPSRLPHFATALQGLASLSLVLLPAALIIGVLMPGTLGVTALTDLPAGPWAFTTWLGIAVSMIPFVFAMLALNAMRRLFALYRKGDPMDPAAGPLIRRIGQNLLISALLGLVLQPARTGLMSLSNPPGERSISIGISSSDIGFILVAGLLMLIGWSMSEAARIAAENREFI